MITSKLIKLNNEDKIYKESPSIRRDFKKLKTNIQFRWKCIKYAFLVCISVIASTEAQNSSTTLSNPTSNNNFLFNSTFLSALLPTVNSTQIQDDLRFKKDIACLYGYSSRPKKCNGDADIIRIFINWLAALLDAIHGERYEDPKPMNMMKTERKTSIEMHTKLRFKDYTRKHKNRISPNHFGRPIAQNHPQPLQPSDRLMTLKKNMVTTSEDKIQRSMTCCKN